MICIEQLCESWAAATTKYDKLTKPVDARLFGK